MVIPQPAHATKTAGAFPIRYNTTITVEPGSPESRAAADLLQAALKARTGNAPTIHEAFEEVANSIVLTLTGAPEGLGREGYTLDATPESVVIRAHTPAGLFYGTQTLRQMIDTEANAGRAMSVPGVRIEDAPRYPWRGFMLDSARHFQSVETVKRLLDAMAYLKLNIFHWHLTDDNAWRLEIKRYPKLTEIGAHRGPDEPGGSGYYTQDQAKEIVAYATARHITVVPEIEMPAHATAAMAAYPELTCAGKPFPIGADGLGYFSAKGGAHIFCPSQEKTYDFIEGVLTEVMEVFPGPVIHLGGDERPEGIWSECPRCQERIRKEGLKNEAALQNAFMARVTDFVNAHRRRTMAWMPTIEFGIPNKQIAEDWYFDVLPDATKLGHDVVNARDRFTYLDYPNFPGRQKPDWMPELSAETMYQFQPTPEGLSPEQAKHVIGSETSLWTEFIEERNLATAIFPRMLSFAEVVWSPEKGRDWPGMQARMAALEGSFTAMGFPYATPEREHGARTKLPATVTSTMEAEGPYPPECAFDGRFVRAFWSAKPPKAGDTLTITLEQPVSAKRIRLYTGFDIVREDTLEDGELQVSTDGESFRTVAKVSGPRTEAEVGDVPIKAIRVRVAKDQERRLAIREVVLATD